MKSYLLLLQVLRYNTGSAIRAFFSSLSKKVGSSNLKCNQLVAFGIGRSNFFQYWMQPAEFEESSFWSHTFCSWLQWHRLRPQWHRLRLQTDRCWLQLFWLMVPPWSQLLKIPKMLILPAQKRAWKSTRKRWQKCYWIDAQLWSHSTHRFYMCS